MIYETKISGHPDENHRFWTYRFYRAGRNLFKYFIHKNPHLEVIGISRREMDLTNSAQTKKLADLFTKETVVVMLSAIKPNTEDNLSKFRQNVSMVTNLCSILEKHPVGRFLYMSSASVYGEDIAHPPISETTPAEPRTYYSIAKYMCERLLWKTLSNNKNCSFLIVRSVAIYGPHDIKISYNPAGFFKNAWKGETIMLKGDGSEKREFLYVDDVVKLLYFFTFHSYDGIINLASGTSYSFRDALQIISSLIPGKISITSVKRSKEKIDIVYDTTLLRRVVPAFRFTPLVGGLTNVADYWKNEANKHLKLV